MYQTQSEWQVGRKGGTEVVAPGTLIKDPVKQLGIDKGDIDRHIQNGSLRWVEDESPLGKEELGEVVTPPQGE